MSQRMSPLVLHGYPRSIVHAYPAGVGEIYRRVGPAPEGRRGADFGCVRIGQ